MDDARIKLLLLSLAGNGGLSNAPKPHIEREEEIKSNRPFANNGRNNRQNPTVYPANSASHNLISQFILGKNNDERNREREAENKDCLTSFWNCFSFSSLLAFAIIICEIGFIVCEIFFFYYIEEYSNSNYFTTSILLMIFLPIYEILTLLILFLVYNTCKCTLR
eukprot:TRINITY_DN29213_c0_g1_i1.p2 TRINITY_DN29213_c0_g1~~TRINITY_DN29213_c0_g1_i1.p2  ORF type:complete len:165 (-),score=5.26 TRINITY_DN29213_c0_g1_i1:3-497(-)